MFWAGFQAAETTSFAKRLAMMNDQSDQETETYEGLGAPPGLKKSGEGPNKTEQPVHPSAYQIKNEPYDVTMRFKEADLRRDKTGMILKLISQAGSRVQEHWDELHSTLIAAGETGLCHDGKFFFAADHEMGKSGAQVNLLDDGVYDQFEVVDKDAPTSAEFAAIVSKMLAHQMGLLDDQGKPANMGGRQFTVMVPMNMYDSAFAALFSDFTAVSARNPLYVQTQKGWRFELEGNPRLTATDELYLFREDGILKPLISQEEKSFALSYLGIGSEEHTKTGSVLLTGDCSRNAGYGVWHAAVKGVLSTA
jgi:phage major head subunit gpT-like protein